ncbi:hypothetical protein M758_7G134400 [Ceratodon purpureus]|nr:hypothetical protein M758_7G134400 [Ceratodon purpureus]
MDVTNGIMSPIKRRRGRPRKTISLTTILRDEGVEDEIHTLKANTNNMKLKKQKIEHGVSVFSHTVDDSLIGQEVIGVLEGTFDAGYFLSLKVGNKGTVLRGVVFSDGIPISNKNNVASSAHFVI